MRSNDAVDGYVIYDVRKETEWTKQCDQCYDDIVIDHNDAAYGASVSDGDVERKQKWKA